MLLAAMNWGWFTQEIQKPLVLFGFTAQFVFFMRFVVQWYASERLGRSHIPISFWYLSLIGAFATFVYALLKADLVIMTGQALAVFIYVRNLMLIYRPRVRAGNGAPILPMDPVADSSLTKP
jgi:lipid-A-disaccharide synthase-like uncharacterized protein